MTFSGKSHGGVGGSATAVAAAPAGGTVSWEGQPCPFCTGSSTSYVTDCFDTIGKKICELWFCNACSGFFPRRVAIGHPKAGAKKASEKASEKSADHASAKASDKRRAPRFPVQFVVQVDFNHKPAPKKRLALFGGRKQSLSEPLLAMVMDAGNGGLCFRHPTPIEEGREGRMLISLPSVAQSFSAIGRVVRSTLLPDGSYGLGVQFIDVDPEYRDALKRYIHLG
jgi:hypothetical protein